MRATAAALIAGALAEGVHAGEWTAGNPNANRTYIRGEWSLVDFDQDGNWDLQFSISEYGYQIYLHSAWPAENQVFLDSEDWWHPVRRFESRDDILSATGPTRPSNCILHDSYPWEGGWTPFATTGFVGCMFDIPGGSLYYGYLQLIVSGPDGNLQVQVTDNGYQPCAPVGVRPESWSAIKGLYRN